MNLCVTSDVAESCDDSMTLGYCSPYLFMYMVSRHNMTPPMTTPIATPIATANRTPAATEYEYNITHLCCQIATGLLESPTNLHFSSVQSLLFADLLKLLLHVLWVWGARRHDHIIPVLTTLHCLPVRKRVEFKTVVLVWKCLDGAAPGYLFELSCFRSLCFSD